MTFQQLNYLIEVAKVGSISKAAENLFVTRSGVSLCIRSLEEELGYPIFLRTPTGLILSTLGEQVLDHATLICNAQKQLKELNQEKSSHIQIASVDYPPVTNAITKLLIENYLRPDITFTVRDDYSEPLKRLAAGELDVVLKCGYPTNQKPPEGITEKVLHNVPVVLLLGPAHRLYHKPILTAEDFRTESLLETPDRALSHISVLRRVIPFDPSRAIAVKHSHLRHQLLSEGVCFAIRRMPDQPYLDQHQLRCLRLEGVHQVLRCYTNPGKRQTPELKQFLSLLEEELQSYREPTITEAIATPDSGSA